MSLNVNLKFGNEDITSLDLTKKEVILTTKDQFCAQDINVKLNVDVYDSEYITLSSIAVTTPPTKVDYEAGDTLNLTGMVITATYSDGSTRVLTSSDYTTSPANGSVLALSTTTINIFYRNKTCTLDITVITPPNYVCFTANAANSTITINRTKNMMELAYNWTYLYYSIDNKATWVLLTDDVTTLTLANIGDKLYMRGINTTNLSSAYTYDPMFVMTTGSVTGSGDLGTLFDYTNSSVSIGNCGNLFNGCTALTTAPHIPNQTEYFTRLTYMFYGCTNLNYISIGFTTWDETDTWSWVGNVAASGTFNCPSGTIETRGDNYIPTNWTITHN